MMLIKSSPQISCDPAAVVGLIAFHIHHGPRGHIPLETLTIACEWGFLNQAKMVHSDSGMLFSHSGNSKLSH